MARLFVDGNEFALNSYWFHYKKPSDANRVYSLIISRNEKELIDIIEEYADCSINDQAFEANVIKKDNDRGSMGLIWNLSIIFEKKYVHTVDERIYWVINNIQKIEISEKELIIKGDVTVFEEDKFG